MLQQRIYLLYSIEPSVYLCSNQGCSLIIFYKLIWHYCVTQPLYFNSTCSLTLGKEMWRMMISFFFPIDVKEIHWQTASALFIHKAKFSDVQLIISTLKKIKGNLTWALSDRLRPFPSESPDFQLSFMTVCR